MKRLLPLLAFLCIAATPIKDAKVQGRWTFDIGAVFDATNGTLIGFPGTGTVLSVNGSGGTTGLTLTGGGTTAVTLTLGGILNVANGGTGTATPGLIAGANITITGVWPNQTIASSAGGGGTWGSISGSLSNQTDLQAALNAKQNALGLLSTGLVKFTTPSTFSTAVLGTDYIKDGILTLHLGNAGLVGGNGNLVYYNSANLGSVTLAPSNAPSLGANVTVGFLAANDTLVEETATETLTHKTINGPDNTLTNIANGSLANSSVTIAGNALSLGGTLGLDSITGLGSTGIVKRTGLNTLAIATPGTDYQAAGSYILTSRSVNTTSPLTGGGALGGDLTLSLIPPTQTGLTAEVWIAKRTDGLSGTGTIQDPLDGSTAAKIDAILATLPTIAKIHLGPSTVGSPFQINSITNYKRWQLQGAGREITYVLMVGALTDIGGGKHDGIAISTAYNYDGSDAMVSDLTLDLNSSYYATLYGNVTFRINGINLGGGKNPTIRNVHLLHGHSDVGTAEFFGLVVGSWYDGANWQPAYNALIEGCLVDQPYALTFGSAIDTFHGASVTGANASLGSGTLRGNTVIGWGPASAYGFVGSNTTIEDNTALSCLSFLYADTGTPNDHLLVRGNHANIGGAGDQGTGANLGAFVQFSSGGVTTFKNVTVEDNDINLWLSSGSTYPTVGLFQLQYVTNLIARGNNISLDARSNTNTYSQWRMTSNVTGAKIYGNTYEKPGLVYVGTNCTNLFSREPLDSRASELAGSFHVSGTITVAGGQLTYSGSTAYTIASGDHLQYEVFVDEKSTKAWPLLAFTDGGGGYGQGFTDQHGLITGGDHIEAFALGRWYFRDIDLTSAAGHVTTGCYFGVPPTDGGVNNTPTGYYSFYFRRIQVVDSNGVPKIRYFVPPEGQVSLGFNGQTNASGYSGLVVGVSDFTGTGTPEGAVTAPVGTTFHRTDGGAATSFYVKESGSGATGWVGK